VLREHVQTDVGTSTDRTGIAILELQASNNRTVSAYPRGGRQAGGRHAEGITPWSGIKAMR
jgi:hypothetical protein